MKYCNTHRKRMQAHSLCRCPKALWWQCDTVCADCVHRNDPESVSLDEQVTSELCDGENSLLDIVMDDSELMEDLMCDADELNHLLHRLKELMPEAIQIGELRDENLSDAEIAFTVIDYISGVMCGIVDGKLSSSIGFKGICRKVIVFMLVGIASILDTRIFQTGSVLRTAVIFFYLSNEGISLLENAAHLGLPIPTVVRKALNQLHDKSENKENENGK